MGSGDQCHVRPIVDDDARRLTRSSLETPLDQPTQLTRFEVRFADGRPSRFFYFDDVLALLTSEQALEQAKARVRAERISRL